MCVPIPFCRRVNSHSSVPEWVRPHAHHAGRQQEILCSLLCQPGSGGRGGEEVFQATGDLFSSLFFLSSFGGFLCLFPPSLIIIIQLLHHVHTVEPTQVAQKRCLFSKASSFQGFSFIRELLRGKERVSLRGVHIPGVSLRGVYLARRPHFRG